MRIFEILVISLLFISFITSRLLKGKRKPFYLVSSLVTGALSLFQVFIEGYRWQMVPAFIFAIGLIIHSLLRVRSDKEFLFNNKVLRSIMFGFLALVLIGSLIFPLLLPVPPLPKPNGPYAVGTISYRMTDPNREEIFSEEPSDQRSLLVTAWYPAEITKGLKPNPYWDRAGITGREYSINAGMGTFWYSHLNQVRTNSFQDANLAASGETYPVLIYSPSFYGLNTENTILIEELASHGYVVFSISHTYETIVTVFPDGEILTGNLEYIFELYDAHADMEELLYEDYEQVTKLEDQIAIIQDILVVDDEITNLLKARTADAIFVLDKIEKLNKFEGTFQGKLNLDKVGILGWSFGGATAIESCLADSRFKAGINIDGWPYGEHFNTGKKIEQPFMVLLSEPEDKMEEIVGDLIYHQINNQAYRVEISDAWHTNFWDFPYFFRIYKYIGFWGPIDPVRLGEINKSYVVGFFDRTLKGLEVELLNESNDTFPEISISTRENKPE